MAYVFSGETYNRFEILLTKKGLNAIVKNEKITYTPFYFSFSDGDIDYRLATSENINTNFTNVPIRGKVPTITGIESSLTNKDHCVNVLSLNDIIFDSNINRGNINDLEEGCEPNFAYFVYDVSNLTVSAGYGFRISLVEVSVPPNSATTIKEGVDIIVNSFISTGIDSKAVIVGNYVFVYINECDFNEIITNQNVQVTDNLLCDSFVTPLNNDVPIIRQIKCCALSNPVCS